MGYKLCCKHCGALLGHVTEVSSRTFSSGCNEEWCEIVTWDKRVELCQNVNGNCDATCYNCETIHSVYSMINGKKYVLRRKK